jgi:hypothetical protein
MLNAGQAPSSNREIPHMRRRFAALAILTPWLVLAAEPAVDKAKDADKSPLRVGANLPGPFHPYNVTGRYGPRKEKDKEEESQGRYHCPVTEHAEDPMVLVFTRDVEIGDKIKSLAKKLDDATKTNTNVRLAAAIVFVDKEDPKPGKDLLQVLGVSETPDKLTGDARARDDKLREEAGNIAIEDRRRELAVTLRDAFRDLFKETDPFTKQNLGVACIASNKDLDKYKLDPTHKATVVLYKNLEVKALHDYEDLDDAKIDAIMKDVADKLGATRK